MKIAIVMGVVLFGYLFVQNWKPDRIGSGSARDDTVTVSSVKNRMKIEKLILIDVRTIQEYNNDHIAGALLIPLDELPNRIHELDSYRSEELIMVCRSGNRSDSGGLRQVFSRVQRECPHLRGDERCRLSR